MGKNNQKLYFLHFEIFLIFIKNLLRWEQSTESKGSRGRASMEERAKISLLSSSLSVMYPGLKTVLKKNLKPLLDKSQGQQN